MKRVAIVGLAPSTHDQAPFDNPDWEVWGLPWDNGYWARCDRLFEMHDIDLLQKPEARRPRQYMERLQEIDVPLYMQEQYFPNVTPYPLTKVVPVTGDYFNSSIAYMIALAIVEGYEEIGIWGVDMTADDEYAYQRPNAEYLIGLALGKGINVLLPTESELMRFNGDGIPLGVMYPHYPIRYGYL